MTPNLRSLYWETNPEWYRINEETDEYELTDKAPPEAVESFKLFKTPRKKGNQKF